jgi:preprotein translocase subunit SecE
MAKKNPSDCARDGGRVGAKVPGPTRKHTTITSGMVFVMVIVASLFFLLVDQTLALGVRTILGLGV